MSTPSHLTMLNAEQYRAVTTVDGPLLILAGAGSGKTRVLTRRIAHILHLGHEPDKIFAVTFTNKAASEMKERVIEMVGTAGEKVWVSTFHSSCCRILRADIENLGWTRRFAIYDDDDQLRMLKHICEEMGIDPQRVPPKSILGQIDHYKNLLMDVDDVLRTMRSYEQSALIQVWRAYEEALRAADAVDFNDLIGLTVKLFKEHPDVLEKWQSKFQFMMVDEYQDTNQGQYQLLRLLAAKHRNLAVVGDDDQSIYGFRGADITIIRNFESDYPDATVIKLEQNYRCSANILAVSNAVIAQDTQRTQKRLWTDKDGGSRVQMKLAKTPQDEAGWVSRCIHQLRRQGHKWEDVAIIYRTNATSRIFEVAMQRAGIPTQIIGGKKFYERREVRDMLSYLRLLVNPADDAALLRILNVPSRGIGAKTLAKLREEAGNRGEPLLRAAKNFGGAKGRAKKGFADFIELIERMTELSRDADPGELVAQLVEDSGYRDMLLADMDDKGRISKESQSRLENLDALVQDAASFPQPEEALTRTEHLTAWLDRIALATSGDDADDSEGRVTLMTVHSSKGLEFPVVFVVHMMEGQFPHARSLEERDADEERRLAYVAFTRAQQRLVISRSAVHPHTGDFAEPSRFLFNLPDQSVSGELPGLEVDEIAPIEDPHARKLASFQERRAPVAVEEPDPDMSYTVIDIEDPSQIRPGARVLHPKWGLGRIQRQLGRQVVVAFRGGTKPIPLAGAGLQLVVD